MVITGRHQLEELFHLRREEAAAQVGCGLTLFKQQCRALGVLKWPCRQVRALLDARGRLERHRQSRSGRCVHTEKALCQVMAWLTQTHKLSPGHPQLAKLPVSLHKFTRTVIDASLGARVPGPRVCCCQKHAEQGGSCAPRAVMSQHSSSAPPAASPHGILSLRHSGGRAAVPAMPAATARAPDSEHSGENLL